MIAPVESKPLFNANSEFNSKIKPLRLSADKVGAGIFSISILFYLFVCTQFLHHSVYWLLGYVADDAFYYLQTARHLAENGHSTFDGINPTNGYHPGWMFIMVLCAKIVHSRVLLFKLSLALEFIFHILGCLVLIKLVREIVPSFWSWIIGCVWLLNPLAFSVDFAGVESAFSRFTILIALWYYQTRIDPFLRSAQSLPRRNLILLGMVLALAYYGRTDQIILAAVVTLALLIGVYRTQALENRNRQYLRVIGFVGVTFLLCVLPWFLFSYLQVGTFSQDSGTMKELWRRQEITGSGVGSLVIRPIYFLMFYWILSSINALVGNGFSIELGVIIPCALLIGIYALNSWRKSQKLSGLSYILLATLIISGLAYGSLIADSQSWHFSSPGLMLFILFSSWAGLAIHKSFSPARQWAAGILLVLCSMFVLGNYESNLAPLYPWLRDVYISQQRFEREVPPQAVIGCFNAGCPAYFGNRRVINLDGLVNDKVVPYWKRNEFSQYLKAAHIDYIADETYSLSRAQRFSNEAITLKAVDVVPLTHWISGYRYLWKVVP